MSSASDDGYDIEGLDELMEDPASAAALDEAEKRAASTTGAEGGGAMPTNERDR